MFSPNELEGEVDHSFFDSDCEDRRGDGGEKNDNGLKAQKESLPPHERLQAKQAENTKGGWSLATGGKKQYLKPVDNASSSRRERKENSCQSEEEERSRLSSVISQATVVKNSSDCEEDSNLQSKKPNRTSVALMAESREVDYKDVYSQTPNESEEDTLPSKHSQGRNRQSPKKLIRNRRTRSPSPTSTESSIDTDSESSSVSPGVRRTRVGSAGSRGVPVSRTVESEDTVTDVSPLSSPDISPLQSLDLNHTESKEGSLKEQQQQESVPSSGLGNMHQDEDLDQDVDECSLRSVSQLGAKLVLNCPRGRNRKNYSFSNDEVNRIDRENQRLLRELSRHSPGPRPGSMARKKTHMSSKSPHIRPFHSTLNRQREQQRIERENQAFLKRLESVKPTPGLNRSKQLEDYQRNIGYLGAPSYSICMSTSKTPSAAGPRPPSSAHHSSRAVSTTTDSSKTPVPRSKKLSATKPAWC